MHSRGGSTFGILARITVLACFTMPLVVSAQSTPSQEAHPAETAQTYIPTLTFDVASIRESPPADSFSVSGGFTGHTSLFQGQNLELGNLLSFAYGVNFSQIAGIPDSFRWVLFNIEAKSDAGTDDKLAKLNKEQLELERKHMLQTLLADRFHLAVHWETKEARVYDLVQTKGGSKMKEGSPGSVSPEETKHFGDRPVPPIYQQGSSMSSFKFIAHGCTTVCLATMLTSQFGAPVRDKTGLQGAYDFVITYHDTRAHERRDDDTNPIPTLETAIQDQLGLKLQAARGPVQSLVIDHVDKPTEN